MERERSKIGFGDISLLLDKKIKEFTSVYRKRKIDDC